MYVITAGGHDDYRIVAVVEGDASPSIETLYERFERRFDTLPKAVGRTNGSVTPLQRAHEEAERLKTMSDNLALAGYDCKPECAFVEWLCREKSFNHMAVDELWVDQGVTLRSRPIHEIRMPNYATVNSELRVCLHCGATSTKTQYICGRCKQGSMKYPQPTIADLAAGYVPTDPHAQSVAKVVRSVLAQVGVRVIGT